MSDRPVIAITLMSPEQAALEDPTWASPDDYLDAVRRAGGQPLALDPTAPPAERQMAFDAMDGLLLSGGADLDPGLYGEEPHPTVAVEAGRDDLELAAWSAARDRRVPILGVCRGFEAINVFSGGSLVQHLEGHDSPASAPESHPLRLDASSRLAAILGGTEPMLATNVNSYHHQGVRPADVAPGLVAVGLVPHHEGDLVEAIESPDAAEWLFVVQCHPERPEFIGPEFARLWRSFVDAARVRSGRRRRS